MITWQRLDVIFLLLQYNIMRFISMNLGPKGAWSSRGAHAQSPRIPPAVQTLEAVDGHKKHYDLIMLVIANPSNIYTPLINQYWKRMIDATEKGGYSLKIFLLFGGDPRPTITIPSDSLIISNTQESLIPGIFLKTMYAFDHISKNYTYNHVLRTNVSSFFRLTNLMALQRTLPSTRFSGGFTGDSRRDTGLFINGAGIWLSADVVDAFLSADKGTLEYHIPDDVAISVFARSRFTVQTLPRLEPIAQHAVNFPHPPEYVLGILTSQMGDHYHVRCKHLGDRTRDLPILMGLMDRFN